MAVFPTLIPSSRAYTPGDYPNTSHRALSGVESRVRHSNVLLDASLSLSFNGITQAQLISIINHYKGQLGSYESFSLPAEVWSGISSVNDVDVTSYRWRYNDPPSVEDLPCGKHIVELRLVTVPPEGAAVPGLSAGGDGFSATLVVATLSPGAVLVSNGIAAVVNAALTAGAGDAPVSGSGITAEVTTSLADGAVQITPAGITASVVSSLTGGNGLVSNGISQTISASLTAGTAAVGDSSFSSVQLLMHMDGTNGSTTFTDSSNNALTVTPFGNAQISTAQSQFGGASALFDGSGDYLIVTEVAGLEPGSADLTWEMWIRTTNSTQYATLISRTPASFASGMWSLMMNHNSSTTGDLALYVANFSTGAPLLLTTGVNVRDGSWHHVAVVRNGSAWTLYVDGTSRATNTWSGTIADISGSIYIGRDQFYIRDFTGHIDEVRITNGVARYSSAFTPSTTAFLNF